MASSNLRFAFSALIHNQTSPKITFSNPNYNTKSTGIRCFFASSPPSTTAIETLAPPANHSVDNTTPKKWEPHRKRKVVMRVGYVGTDYRGLQLQKDDSISTIEKELVTAIYKAGGICDTNLGDLQKIGWSRSIQTDKGVHSLSTVVSFKMEIPEYAWIKDRNGMALANLVNLHLPKNIRVFSILPSQKSFDARKECSTRKYSYLLPIEIIGITNNFSATEIEHHLSDFRDILNSFVGEHPFHNYTMLFKYRKKYPAKQSPDSGCEPPESIFEENDGEESSELVGFDEELIGKFDANGNSLEDQPVLAEWLHQPDWKDKINGSYFKRIFQCSCGNVKHSFGASYVDVSICGDSFMLNQICKMVGTAVAIKRGLLPRDVIPLSLNKFSRFVLPSAPSELLVLRWNHFVMKKQPGKVVRPEIRTLIESEKILKDVEDFYKSILMPQVLGFLDPLKCPWKEWVELLDANTRIPDSQLDQVRDAWIAWEEQLVGRAKAASL